MYKKNVHTLNLQAIGTNKQKTSTAEMSVKRVECAKL